MTDIEVLLDKISVFECDEMNAALLHAGDPSRPHPPGWWGVCDEDSMRAYFMHKADAFRYRLDLINGRLNPWTQ